MARRRFGASAARELASCGSLSEALDRRASTPYAHQVRSGMTLGEAQHAVAATTLWHYRVLSGWVPTEGVQLLRVMAAGFEIANVDRLLDCYSATPDRVEMHRDQLHPGLTYQLGALTTAWPRLVQVRSATALRATLARFSWGTPARTLRGRCELGCGWPGRTEPSRCCPPGGCWGPPPCSSRENDSRPDMSSPEHPANVHYGHTGAVSAQLSAALAFDRQAHPERFGTDQDPKLLAWPTDIWINPPAETSAA